MQVVPPQEHAPSMPAEEPSLPAWTTHHRRALTLALALVALAGLVEAALRGRLAFDAMPSFLAFSPLLGPALAAAALLLVHDWRRAAVAMLAVCAIWVVWGLAAAGDSLPAAWLRWFGTAAACIGLGARLLRPRFATLAMATAAGSVLVLLGLIASGSHLGAPSPYTGLGMGWGCIATYFAIAALLLPHPSLDGWRPSVRWYSAAAALGLAVLCVAAWSLGAIPLLQLGTGQRPAPLTLSLCLLLLAIALLEWRRGAAWLLPPLLVVAPLAVTILLDEFATDGFAIAQRLAAMETARAGMPLNAMAASSAITCLVAVVGLLCLHLRDRLPALLVIGWVAGALMAAAALVVLSGYALDLAEVRAWGMDSPMAPMTAIGFLLLGTGLASADWHTERVRGQQSLVIPLVLGVASAALAVGLWIELRNESARLRSQTENVIVDGMAQALETSLDNRIRAYGRLGYRLARSGSSDFAAEFAALAVVYLREPSPLRGLALLDADGRLLAAASDPLPWQRHTAELAALAARARSAGQPQASAARPWQGESEVFLLLVPVEDEGGPVAFIASAHEVDEFVAAALKAHPDAYRVDLWATDAPQAQAAPAEAGVRAIERLGQHWRIAYAGALGDGGRHLPTALLIGGLILSALLAVALHLAALARMRASVAAAALKDRQRVLDGSRDVICTLDRQGRFLEANPAARELWGRTPAELLGRPYPDLVLPEDADAVRAELAAVVAEASSARLAHRCARADGGIVHVEWSVQWLADSGRLVGLARDVSERVAYEHRLTRAMDELTRKNRELQEFAYVASHDLQEPLRKVRSFAERVLERAGPALDAVNRDYLARMNSAAARMQTLIHDLLEFTRVETRGRAFQSIDLTRLVEEVQSDLEQSLEASEGRIAHGELPVVEADPTQMRQVFQNILSNALKFTRPGVPAAIRIHADPASVGGREGYRIAISDNGIGFDAEHAEEIFAPFKRLHGRSAYEGTGIGLAIVRRIVERHGGTIAAASQPGQGATFTLWLPRRQAAQAGNGAGIVDPRPSQENRSDAG